MGVKRDIEKWKSITDKITSNWIKEYFELEEDEYIDGDWVANDIGGIFNFADYYFDFNTVLKCYEMGITKKQLFAWYDFCLQNHSVNISLAKFILSPEERKEAEEKHLEELKERVKFAQEEFEKALREWEK